VERNATKWYVWWIFSNRILKADPVSQVANDLSSTVGAEASSPEAAIFRAAASSMSNPTGDTRISTARPESSAIPPS
jgi:hypothetical protein